MHILHTLTHEEKAFNRAYRRTTVIPVLGKWRWEDHELKASLDNKVRSYLSHQQSIALTSLYKFKKKLWSIYKTQEKFK